MDLDPLPKGRFPESWQVESPASPKESTQLAAVVIAALDCGAWSSHAPNSAGDLFLHTPPPQIQVTLKSEEDSFCTSEGPGPESLKKFLPSPSPDFAFQTCLELVQVHPASHFPVAKSQGIGWVAIPRGCRDLPGGHQAEQLLGLSSAPLGAPEIPAQLVLFPTGPGQ